MVKRTYSPKTNRLEGKALIDIGGLTMIFTDSTSIATKLFWKLYNDVSDNGSAKLLHRAHKPKLYSEYPEACRSVLDDKELFNSVSEFFNSIGSLIRIREDAKLISNSIIYSDFMGRDYSATPVTRDLFSIVTALYSLGGTVDSVFLSYPETSLPVVVQRALGNLILETLVSKPEASVVITTQSEVFLLVALMAAVQSILGIDRVHLYHTPIGFEGGYVVKPIELHDDGQPKTSVFEHMDNFNTLGKMRRELLALRVLESPVRPVTDS